MRPRIPHLEVVAVHSRRRDLRSTRLSIAASPSSSVELLKHDTTHRSKIVPCVPKMPPAEKKMQYVSLATPPAPPPLTSLPGSELESRKSLHVCPVTSRAATAFSQVPVAEETSGTIGLCLERTVPLRSQKIDPVNPGASPPTMRAAPL